MRWKLRGKSTVLKDRYSRVKVDVPYLRKCHTTPRKQPGSGGVNVVQVITDPNLTRTTRDRDISWKRVITAGLFGRLSYPWAWPCSRHINPGQGFWNVKIQLGQLQLTKSTVSHSTLPHLQINLQGLNFNLGRTLIRSHLNLPERFCLDFTPEYQCTLDYFQLQL